ncbi:hypothetical protein D3OALGA1CA_3117 [Olavius algarvensis associated proteobacterium Delta 3]|nr:hypothetical protein D3OALGA1CA_3117 [Olavius algarvensis associated proteobacterium Delta 3]
MFLRYPKLLVFKVKIYNVYGDGATAEWFRRYLAFPWIKNIFGSVGEMPFRTGSVISMICRQGDVVVGEPFILVCRSMSDV